MSTDDLLLVGRVARPHGIRGQVIVTPETDFPGDRFRNGQTLLVGAADRPVERRITEVRFHQGRPILALDGIETMDAAEGLAGAEVWVHQGGLEPLPAGTYYRHDLVGCEVQDRSGGVIGRVTAVEGTLDRSYLVVDGHVMLPLVEGICAEVDMAARRIVVDPPAGLLEIYRP
ncbi:MAG: ribosome maturation factor RimM [Acidobacteriota bacterium]